MIMRRGIGSGAMHYTMCERGSSKTCTWLVFTALIWVNYLWWFGGHVIIMASVMAIHVCDHMVWLSSNSTTILTYILAVYASQPSLVPSGLILQLTTTKLHHGSTARHVTHPPDHKPRILLGQIKEVKTNQVQVLLDPLLHVVVAPPHNHGAGECLAH